MLKLVGGLLIAVFLQGCNVANEIKTLSDNVEDEKVWAFIQFNVPEEGNDVESYYYFAEISKPLLQSINNNSVSSGFIFLQNVRYWGSNDVIHEYKDKENTGDILFRIEDIRKLKTVNDAPVIGQGIEQYADDVIEQLKDLDPANAQG
ncbi:hypothetical protein [Rheinheimera maricola]|uniref:Uncharacterized protein n=1 Tax=Rheinheimera maricola TaxID=2793282 RepID=A0ABS7X8L6_9GAMM|nr:hypothetical protein [Rheinheimera maricola]MBZ9611869.1 hypothetical protein [Rheinheimera maricola]